MPDDVELLKIRAHGATLRMEDTGGKIAKCYRQGVPYERALLEHIHYHRVRYHRVGGDLAIDVGANIGNHALWFALVCRMEVIAFEPLQADLLRRHVALNDADNLIRVEEVGLSDTDGVAGHVGKGRLDPSSPAGLAHSTGEHPLWASTRTGGIQTRTLDSFQLDRVSLIKVDVEGMETHVLRGGEETIRRDEPVIFAEEWGQAEQDAIADVLEPWGYHRTRSFGKRTKMGEWQRVGSSWAY